MFAEMSLDNLAGVELKASTLGLFGRVTRETI
jgi:hypothetical protein